ncbi:MAG: lipoprotein-releasing ABC transporter permease subunit [Desulfovibrionales bacterium]
MSFELFIALRYLLARRKQAFISVISLISVCGVALGVASLIVVLGVMNGFSHNLQEKILGVNAHMVVSSVKGTFTEYRDVAAQVAEVSGVTGVTPFVYSEVMVSNPSGVKGVVLRGIDPDTAGTVLSLGKDMVEGGLADLKNGNGMPGIIVGRDLADRLGLDIGSPLNVLSPTGKKTAAGFSPEIRIFQVKGIFDTGMYEYDSTLAYTSIPALQDLLGFNQDMVNGLEVKLQDVYAAKQVAENVGNTLGGFPFYVRDWMEMNESLFSALKLEKTAMFVILVMIVLVGSFSIVTTLVMLVMEKTRDIAILMAMGARTKSIRRIFVLQGTIIGAVGTTLGVFLGIGLSFMLKEYKFIKLPADVYYLDHLPIRMDWFDLGLICVAAVSLCFLATIYPARQAAGLQPAEALRYE